MVRTVLPALLLVGCAAPRMAELAGTWETYGGFTYSRIDLDPSGSVYFTSSGCLDSFACSSKATLRGDTVTLSPPAREYVDSPVSTLRHMRRGGREYLVPDDEIEDFLADGGKAGDYYHGFRRRLPKGLLQDRIRGPANAAKRLAWLEEWDAWPDDGGDAYFLEDLTGDRNDAMREAARDLLREREANEWKLQQPGPEYIEPGACAEPAEDPLPAIHPSVFAMVECWLSDTEQPVMTEISLDAVGRNRNQFSDRVRTEDGWTRCDTEDGRGFLRYQVLDHDGDSYVVRFQSNGGGSLTTSTKIGFTLSERTVSVVGQEKRIRVLRVERLDNEGADDR